MFHPINNKKKFLFSVIMAIYNTGRYLNDSINSLLNQTINFEKNIQLILVNDGSIDRSEEICLNYKIMYPNNIIYIKLVHSGVSRARNEGINYAKGLYINFLDPDDKWDYKAFKYILLFYKVHKNVNLVAGRLKFFEASENYHCLDYKFYKTRIVNLTEEYNCIHQSVSSSFFKNTLIKGQRFKEGVFYGEDTRFVDNILLKNPIIGVIREAVYYYRVRADSSSAVQNKNENINFYSNCLNQIEKYLINRSKALHNKIVPFIQYFISYDILFRLKNTNHESLNYTAYNEYSNLIKEILMKIEDKYILEQKILSNKYILFALCIKYNTDLRYEMKFENKYFFYLNRIFIDLNSCKDTIIWRILDIKNNILHLEGKDNLWIPRETYYYYANLGNKTYYPKYYDYQSYDFNTMYGIIQKGRIIIFDIPLELYDNITNLTFYISSKNFNENITTSLGLYSHISSGINGYYSYENYIITYNEDCFNIFKYSKNLEKKFEKDYLKGLKIIHKENIINLRRIIFKFKQMKNRKNKHYIWIINDRHDRAGDNGEYFFRYLTEKKPNNVNAYFAIEKNCSDYKRLKKYGNILDLNSIEYIYTFVISDKIISSISNSWISNPFNKDYKYIKDLLHFEVIFLQHGIIKDDLSKYLNKYNKKYDYFVTSSKSEYKSILAPQYGYDKSNVILTGLPRYDSLQRLKYKLKKEKIIVIIPTWRIYIKGTVDSLTYKSIHSDNFINTDYFNFYNNLINDEHLLYYMNKNNYTGIFCLHPCFTAQWSDFKHNELFKVSEKCNYQKYLIKSSLLITDYSSIFFDFGYLKKPIIYAHFDYNKYRNYHYKKGYFDYISDGFGPVCKDINCVINEIIYEIENNCIIKKKYLKRINKFFTFHDEKNCERIFKTIIKSKKEIKDDVNKYIFYLFFLIFIIIIFDFKIIFNRYKLYI